MKLTNSGAVPVYTIAGASTARPLPEWLARKRKRSLKADAEYTHRVELLQDFEFDEASQCVRVSDDGEWVMSTGELYSMLLSVLRRNSNHCSFWFHAADSVLSMADSVKAPTNHRSTPTIYHISHYLSPDIPTP